MTFLVFEQFAIHDRQVIRPTGDQFKLAGYNLIYRAWEERGKPLNEGWHISRDDLLNMHFASSSRPEGAKLVIDFHPNSQGRIGLIEPMEIFAYTYGDKGRAVWTPLMLKLRDVYYEEFDKAITAEAKKEIMDQIPADFKEGQEFIEFLYVNGDDKGWNWGRNGMTNAAFLHDDARNYFRRFF